MTSEHSGPRGLAGDLRDAIAPRTVLLVLGVLLLQLGFILSYVGAFHSPTPHRIAVAVVGPQETVDRINAIDGTPIEASPSPDPADARQRVLDRDVEAAYLIDTAGTTDTLLVATAAGPALATAVEQVFTQLDAAQNRTLTVTDLVPPQPGDARGLTAFYAVVGWLVGGYLAAAALGIAKGARPATLRRTAIRLAAMVPYAIVSGLGGALVVDQVLGALTGHFLSLWWIGAALTFAAATVTMAFQVLFGVIGVGITVLIFVILGNPSAGGAYQTELLPPFWRAIGDWLPNGAGTEAIRDEVYFAGNATGGPIVVLVVWGVAGLVVTLLASAFRIRRENAANSITLTG
ncbi:MULTISPECIES: ABC transporter permease [Amycolatopsis]|uniref:ABC transporter permease n=1 Tax=Amycolatopsis thermalba TaxID=944492 RepID=A0ABY4P577_9PSEU|nr:MULTISPECIES: ABC transporter permease [Amycolatopsis]OXM73331.1 DUF3533 domain-containing protein [Amycolatopsis sp. KNN50.9b]UQS27346.1 ABC transporter permease [Amycolatopsis thermalba]